MSIFLMRAPPSAGSRRGQLGQHVLTECVDEAGLVLADEVQVELVPALVEVFLQPVSVLAEVARDHARTVPTRSAVTASPMTSNASTVSMSQGTGGAKTLLRHWSWAMARASSSVGAQLRWICRRAGPRPPASR